MCLETVQKFTIVMYLIKDIYYQVNFILQRLYFFIASVVLTIYGWAHLVITC
jgi:hypothetical protein